MSTETSLKPKNDAKLGKIVIVRPSKIAEEGFTGTVAEGVFEKMEPNKFDNTKNDYFIRGADDTLYILNSTKGLKEQLEQDGVLGKAVRVEYKGKVATKNKKGYHDFECFLK